MDPTFDMPLYAYARARSAGFTLEYFLLNSLPLFLPSLLKGNQATKPRKPRSTRSRDFKADLKTLMAVRKDLFDLLKRDSENIANGAYPLSVLYPESPLRHFRRFPKLVADSFSIYQRKLRGRTTEFDPRARELLSELPRYYRRNFHFQTSGYLSKRSAEVYDHQVELLFKGSADAMRRLILPPLRRHFGKTAGEGLRFLEIGAGTGRGTRFVHLAFPKARIVATDLSDPYLKVAQKNLSRFPKIDFIQSDGADLPFKDQEFDAVYSVFLFHELPRAARQEILAESRRVLKPGGFLGLVDSLQTGDKDLFDPLLQEFPKEFHEPFYRDYVSHPMEKLLEEQEFRDIRTDLGFSSKVCSAIRGT